MKIAYECNGRAVNLEANPEGIAWSINLSNGTSYNLELKPRESFKSNVAFDLHLRGSDELVRKQYSVPMAQTGRGIEISYLGKTYVFTEPETVGRARQKRSVDTGTLTAPMVGVLSDVLVAEGETVAAYQPLAIVEAMKVMATIEAPFAGTVRRLFASKGDQLTHGQPIIEIAPTEKA